MGRDRRTPTNAPSGARPVPSRRSIIPRWLYSMKFAIWIAVALAVASVAGTLVQEFFPVRSEAEAQQLAARLPGPVVKAFFLLQLQDPFRAHWFRVLLGALAVSLAVCSLRRVRSSLRQAFSLHVIREPRSLTLLQSSVTLHHVQPALFESTVAGLKRRLYHGKVEREADTYAAALHQGGISRTGPVLLHLGVLALVFAGLVSSIVGKSRFLQIAPGSTEAIPGTRYAIRVDDFQIDRNDAGAIKQYRSQIAFLDNGTERAGREITVNHPMRCAGYNIYQASYTADPRRASAMHFAVRQQQPAASDAHAGHAMPPQDATSDLASLDLTMDTRAAVPGFPGYEVKVARFFGHLSIGPDGASDGGNDFANPAAQLEVWRDGQQVANQWAFLRFPAMASSDLPFVLELRDAQPAMMTGLEINTNPGAPLVWLGFALSTAGLLLAFLVQHRCVFVLAKPEAHGWTLWVAGRSDRAREGFAREFERVVAAVRVEAQRQRTARTSEVPDRQELENPPGPALLTPFA
jgi:cytochrome c biogenesis protein